MKIKKIFKNQKGFTIIEVALVLAIGALIFLVVFLAVPALQRNQRNDAKKRDVSNVVEAIASYISNNPSGSLGAVGTVVYRDNKGVSGATFGDYLDTLSNNTETVSIASRVQDIAGSSGNNNSGKIFVIPGQRCQSTSGGGLSKATNRQAAVVAVIETANGHVHYCSSAN